MSTIRITKRFSFEAGHALYGYDGKCKNLHGHSYKLSVTVIGTPITDKTKSILVQRIGGGKRDRTADPLHAMQVLSQLSYTPVNLSSIIFLRIKLT